MPLGDILVLRKKATDIIEDVEDYDSDFFGDNDGDFDGFKYERENYDDMEGSNEEDHVFCNRCLRVLLENHYCPECKLVINTPFGYDDYMRCIRKINLEYRGVPFLYDKDWRRYIIGYLNDSKYYDVIVKVKDKFRILKVSRDEINELEEDSIRAVKAKFCEFKGYFYFDVDGDITHDPVSVTAEESVYDIDKHGEYWAVVFSFSSY